MSFSVRFIRGENEWNGDYHSVGLAICCHCFAGDYFNRQAHPNKFSNEENCCCCQTTLGLTPEELEKYKANQSRRNLEEYGDYEPTE